VLSAVLVAGGCASSGNNASNNGDDAGSSSGGKDGSMGGDALVGADVISIDAPFNADAGCATGNYQADFLPAAMLVVLDGSGTMAGTKWSTAQQAIVTAIDENAFDSAYLGLLVYPTSLVPGPACILGIDVACGVSGLAQVPLALAGMNKSSDPTGVRHDIYQQLVASAPAAGPGNGNPGYLAIQNGISILQSWPVTGKRILFYITDGGASCASVSSPMRPGYDDGNGCPDWEYPTSIATLVQNANNDPTSPVNTIFVGVTGADTTSGVNNPPYSVRLAMSAEAWAGSPQTCDPNCNGKVFTQSGGDPSMPCHFDMSVNYSPTILANAINQIRGSLLGCVFDVPQPDGGTVNPGEVNVQYTSNGMTVELAKRANSSNMCTTGNGCWDYNSSGQIVLIGPACTTVEGDPNADVQIVVGCQTITTQ
jgi:hypothetical protein